MLVKSYPWGLSRLIIARPTVGSLLDLCDENYRALRRLAPDLPELRGWWCSRLANDVDLHLEIREQTPYSSLVHLTYYLRADSAPVPDPAATLRAYHDARQVEVVGLSQTAYRCVQGPCVSLEGKWRLSLFLSKWLTYCIAAGHRFPASDGRAEGTPCGPGANTGAANGRSSVRDLCLRPTLSTNRDQGL